MLLSLLYHAFNSYILSIHIIDVQESFYKNLKMPNRSEILILKMVLMHQTYTK